MYKRLCEYIKNNKVIWLALLVFTLMVRGVFFLSDNIGIDTEEIIVSQSISLGWLNIGRYGLVVLKVLLGNRSFNPYLCGILVILLLPAICILWTYLFSYISKTENKGSIFAFSLILITSQILTEQLYFKLQAVEICIGFALTAICLLVCFDAFFEEERKQFVIIKAAAALLISILTFGLYQSFVPLFIFGAAISVLIYALFNQSDSNTNKYLFFNSLKYIGIFIAGFVISQIIGRCISGPSSDYLGGQIFWKEFPVARCLYLICAHIASAMLGRRIYYCFTYIIIVALLIALIICKTLKSKRNNKLIVFLAATFTLASPFLLTIYCGAEPIVRSQLVLPFMIAGLSYVICLSDTFSANRYVKVILAAVIIVTIYIQLSVTARLEYSDMVRYEGDKRLAAQLQVSIDELQNEDLSLPIVFYGKRQAKLNDSCIAGETCGRSFFEWDTDVEPAGYYSTKRVLSFMKTQGIEYTFPTFDIVSHYQEYAKDMPVWPSEGSIQRMDDVIIIKIGQ